MSRTHAAAPSSSRCDWESLLPRVLGLIEESEQTPTTPELWEALVGEGLTDPERYHPFKVAMTRWRRRGMVPADTAGRSGPPPGTPWTSERRDAEAHAVHHGTAPGRTVDDIATLVERRRAGCAAYLRSVLDQRGQIAFDPATLSRLQRAGYGRELIRQAVAELMYLGTATVGRARGGVVFLARVNSTHCSPQGCDFPPAKSHTVRT